jgi:hypothetical protein
VKPPGGASRCNRYDRYSFTRTAGLQGASGWAALRLRASKPRAGGRVLADLDDWIKGRHKPLGGSQLRHVPESSLRADRWETSGKICHRNSFCEQYFSREFGGPDR